MSAGWSIRHHALIGGATLAILLAGFGSWAVFSRLSGAIVTTARLEVERNRQIIQHPDGGVVESIEVTEGQLVAAGDLLLRLDGSLLRSELSIVEGQLDEIAARHARLEAERDDAGAPVFPAALLEKAAARAEVAEQVDGQARLFVARRDTLAQETAQLSRRSAQIDSQIEGIDAQRVALDAQLDLIRRELADQQALYDKGLAEVGRVLALQREEARLRGNGGDLTAQRGEANARITETEIEVLRLAAARREEASTQLRDIGYQELELAERRRALAERIARLDIRAPVSGIVLGLQVTTPRAVLRAADPALYLVPQDRPLVIAAEVPPIHIDEVFPGQPARLVFSAFSARSTPELRGHVTLVSADALINGHTQMPYYRAEIVLDPGEVARLGDLALVPGMPVEVFIRTGERSPLAYLVKPFTDYFAHAFRES